MILAALLLAQAAVAPPPEDDLVVVARKLSNIAIEAQWDQNGAPSCKFTKTSGDPELDQAACDVFLGCWPRFRKRKSIVACVTPGLQALIPRAKLKD